MTLFVVQAQGRTAAALAKARFVEDRFSKPAFVFAWAWLLYHRLWLALLVWIALEAAFLVFALPHVGGGVALAVDLLGRLLLGLEGNTLRLKGNAEVQDLVAADNRDEAEMIFYRRQFDEAPKTSIWA